MAYKTRKTRQKAPGGRSTPSPTKQRSPEGLIEQVGADVRALGERLAACERQQEETLAAVARAMDAMHAREDETQAAIHELQAAIEPVRMAAAGTSPDEITRHVDYLGLVARVRRLIRDRLPRAQPILHVRHSHLRQRQPTERISGL